jgi:hypothetical protein
VCQFDNAHAHELGTVDIDLVKITSCILNFLNILKIHICVHRYNAIVYPLRRRLSRRMTIVTIVAIWTFAALSGKSIFKIEILEFFLLKIFANFTYILQVYHTY